MNFVFWLGVIVVAVLLWFCLSWIFPGVGSFLISFFRQTKSDIESGDENDDELE